MDSILRRLFKIDEHPNSNRAPGVIEWREQRSEFEIQAELYGKLRRLGYKVRGNVPAICPMNGQTPKVWFDLVIFDLDRGPRLIVECKNSGSGFELNPGTRQHYRYNLFGLPVLKYCERNQEKTFLRLVEEKMKTVCGNVPFRVNRGH